MTQASENFLAAIRNDDAEIRYAAWSHAGETDPEVIPELAKLLVADKPGVRKAADESLKNIVHSVGKEPAGTRRAAVVRQFIALTASGPTWVRTVALRHLSLIGGDETVPAAAKLLLIPLAQRAPWLIPQPAPRQLHHDPAHMGVTGARNPQVTLRLAALVPRGD